MLLPSWILIAIALLVALVLLIRSVDQIYILTLLKDKFFYIFIVLVFAFLAISLTHIHATYDIDFTSSNGIGTAFKIYWSWLVNVGKNIGRVSGYAIKQD